MPTMDGFEFVRRLREHSALAQTPVIFYTATYLESETRNLARACGVTHIITKPAEPQHILDAVSRNLGTRPASSAPPPLEEVRQKHLGLLLAKLSQKAESVVPRLDAMIELGLQLASERDPQQLLGDFCAAARKGNRVGARNRNWCGALAAVGVVRQQTATEQHFDRRLNIRRFGIAQRAHTLEWPADHKRA